MNDTYVPDNPLIVQSDHSLLLEVHSPRSEAAREAIAPFAELIRSPDGSSPQKRGENVV
jgi:DNA excision repair protein ERCC-3